MTPLPIPHLPPHSQLPFLNQQTTPNPLPARPPLLGNTLQLSSRPHIQFLQWARQYGEIYRVRLEILDKQSAKTSSRPTMPVVSDALSGGMRFLFMPYGARWRRLRTLSHRLLSARVSEGFQPSHEFEASQLVYDILADSALGTEFYMHVRRYTVSVLMTSTYGMRIPKWVSKNGLRCIWECDDVRGIYQIGRYIADGVPGLANLLPARLQWWRKSLRPMLDRQTDLWMGFWTRLQKQMEKGEAPECFVKQFIESDFHSLGISEIHAAFLAGLLIEAGAESTSAAINTCMLYLCAYPDVQQRAHEELDRVLTSQNRSPTFIKETLRIRPLTSMGIPHYTTADIRYKNYTILANSVVAINQYALHHNADIPPPRAAVYAAAANPYERDHWDFGAGRRICPGMHLAENSLFITIAKILWAFRVVAVGKVDLSDEAFLPGSMTVPKPFEVRFVPRSGEVGKVVREDWGGAEAEELVLRDVSDSSTISPSL
ncbi:cytochrome P450 [Aspergillus crustosus]